MRNRWLLGLAIVALCAMSYVAGRTFPGASSTAGSSQAPVAVARDSAAAEQIASRTIDDALTRRVWSDDDAAAFRKAAPEMSAEGRERLVRRLTVALNTGQMRVTVRRGPPF